VKTWTLRTRLTAWSVLVTAIALLIFGALFTGLLHYRQLRALDHQLTADAHVFFLEYREHGAPSENDLKEAMLLLRAGARLRAYAFGRSGTPPTDIFPDNHADLFAVVRPAGFTSQKYRGVNVHVGAFEEDGVTLVLVANLHPIEQTVRQSVGVYLLTLPLVLLAVGVGSSWLARRALHPLTEMTKTAAGISASRLEGRLAQPAVDDEIGRHIAVLNDMFDRLHQGFEQATRFTADASHELRTPLTILRGEIEHALRSGKFTEAQEPVLVSLLEQVDHLQKITGNLLLLARFDAGKTPLTREPVDLSALVTEAAEDAELLASPGGLTVVAETTAGLQVNGDPVLLRRLLLNLVDNAVKHNRPDGTVRLQLTPAPMPGSVRFVIANTGPGIPAERHGLLFERFLRVAADRARSSGGTGLGLSLCREIARAHGGDIALTRGEANATEFTVTLPAA